MTTLSSSKAIAKVILLTKDESHLIEDFIVFYGELFGYSNVVVIDNGSTCSDVLGIYKVYQETKGVTIITDERPFVDAHIFMSEHMKSLAETCEWILPLETDEFMYCIPQASNKMFFLERKDVEVYLRSIPDNVSIINYGTLMGSVVDPNDETYDKNMGAYPRPTTDITKFSNQGWDKLIIRSSEFVRMSQWCHHAEVKTPSVNMCLNTDFLGLLHYHDTGFRRKLESAARVLKTFPYIQNINIDPNSLIIEDVRRKHQACQVFMKKGVACGHKIEYYDLFLRRILAIHALKDLFDGRTPASYEELDSITDNSDPEMIIMQHKLMNDLPPQNSNTSYPTTEMLLFHDSSPADWSDSGRQTIMHVKNFFLSRQDNFLSRRDNECFQSHKNFEEIMNRYASANNMYGTDKTVGHAYGPLYSYLLETMNKKNVHAVLEIGVFSGASVQSLSEFFPKAVVVGIDITLDHVKFGNDNPMVTYIKGDGTSAEVAKSLAVNFDLVIDDGSHIAEDQVAALDAFAPFLRPGGMFIIEDISSRNNLVDLRNELEKVAIKHGLTTPIDWFDMRHIAGRFDDIVAVIRRP